MRARIGNRVQVQAGVVQFDGHQIGHDCGLGVTVLPQLAGGSGRAIVLEFNHGFLPT